MQPSINSVIGTFVALSTILGSGMMILPGTSYFSLHGASWIPWAVAAVSVIPMLFAYAWLGRAYPSSSGVAHYSQVAFGKKSGASCGFMALFALFCGIPATAGTGGRYIQSVVASTWAEPIFAVSAVAIAIFVTLMGASLSGRVQMFLIILLVLTICALSAVALTRVDSLPTFPSDLGIGAIGSSLVAVYVAFTGWETVSFTFEEHRRSDLIPRVFTASYITVVGLYAILIVGLYVAVDADDPTLNSAPLLALATNVFGKAGTYVVFILVIVAICANLAASVLAVSRLTFGLARSGFLPSILAKVDSGNSNPKNAVYGAGIILIVITALTSTHTLELHKLFSLSGGTYFVLYAVGAVCLFKLWSSKWRWPIFLSSLFSVGVVTVISGWELIQSWLVFIAVIALCSVVSLWKKDVFRNEPTLEDALG